MLKVVFYVTGHGFGHATRSSALAGALSVAARASGRPVSIHVRTSAPAWLFTDEDPRVVCSQADIDVGMLQPNAMDIDFGRTLAAHEAFCADWDRNVAREAEFLSAHEAGLVLGDIPALAFAAAAKSGVPSAGVSNFSWDWILEEYAHEEPRWRPVVERYARAYAACGRLYRLPFPGFSAAFRDVVDAPLVARRSKLTRDAARKLVGLSSEDKAVLVSFGGLGGAISVERARGLDGIRFLGFGPRPRGFGGDWRELPNRLGFSHVDLLAACDALIGKPGYGTVSECLAHGTPMLYLARTDFRETPVLVEGLSRLGRARCLPREDFLAGRWRDHLEALWAQAPGRGPVPADGAEFIARDLLAYCAASA